jgi:ribose 5-phosphate isomerase B
MRLAIGADHGGYRLKDVIKRHLKDRYELIDMGTDTEASVDYPDFAHKVAEGVIKGEVDKGILICGTGIGISISANKIPGIRAALCSDCFSAQMSIEHNNANILALGERVLGEGLALKIVDTWLESRFQGDRHQRRVDKITGIEKVYCK